MRLPGKGGPSHIRRKLSGWAQAPLPRPLATRPYARCTGDKSITLTGAVSMEGSVQIDTLSQRNSGIPASKDPFMAAARPVISLFLVNFFLKTEQGRIL